MATLIRGRGAPLAASRHLVLVRHSIPEVAPGLPAREWRLTPEGSARATQLAERLADYRPAFVASSPEPKALATAEIIAQRLQVSVEMVPGLQEHERSRAPFMNRERYATAIARFFAAPQEVVFGDESATQARERFTHAVNEVIVRSPGCDTVVVTHGTVMALFAAAATGIDPLPFWRGLGLPCFVALALPDLRVISRGDVPDTP